MKAQNTPNTPQDGRVTAQQNELDILTYINRFGWLRSRDLAALIWPEAKTSDSAMAMAQRTLKRLKDGGQILHRIAPDGATVYALSEAGARRIGNERGVDARSGKDLVRELGNYTHRCHANTFAIHRINAGQRVWQPTAEIHRQCWRSSLQARVVHEFVTCPRAPHGTEPPASDSTSWR